MLLPELRRIITSELQKLRRDDYGLKRPKVPS